MVHTNVVDYMKREFLILYHADINRIIGLANKLFYAFI